MKPIKIFLGLLLASVSLSAFSQKPTETKTILLKEVFTTLTVNDDITVVLTNGKPDEITVEGDLKALEIRVGDGELSIAKRDFRPSDRIKVYIPANYLTKVFMNGNGTISSAQVLSNPRMRIMLSGEAAVAIRSIGNVTVETTNDIQFVKSR